MTITPFADEKDAVRQANAVRYGLMATWTGDPARGPRVARQIKAGTVGVNMPYTRSGHPFGGYKQSGFGRELARDARALPRDQERPHVDQRQAVQPVRAVTPPPHPYRWVVLAGGTTAQASFSAIGIGLPALAPAIQGRYGLSLSQIGIVLAAEWIGALLTLLPWGLAADRFGERLVLGFGSAAAPRSWLEPRTRPTSAGWSRLGLAGAAGASVNSASGRAVMHWFGPSQRGLALGIRQTAIPAGGLVAALVLPHLGLAPALFLAGLCLAGAIAGGSPCASLMSASFRRTRSTGRSVTGGCGSSAGSGLYLVTQVALIGFVVLFLHDQRNVRQRPPRRSRRDSGRGRGAAHRRGALVGRARSRIVPIRRLGYVTAIATGSIAALTAAPLWLLVPLFVVAGGLSMSWNGLSFTAAAELAGRRSGAAIGFQQSVLAGVGAAAPVLFAALVAAISWRAGFALAPSVRSPQRL